MNAFEKQTDQGSASEDRGNVSQVTQAVSILISSIDSELDQQDVCRICHSGNAGEPLLAPCCCSGTVKYVHETCLQRWLLRDVVERNTVHPAQMNQKCELCGTNFVLTTRLRPFREWKKLDMTFVERRKVACSAVFHVIAVSCVAWSLYVLIDRAVEEVRESGANADGTRDILSALQWPFWTKLAVVAVGLIGAVVFVYIQFKAYIILIARWRSINRIIHVKGQLLRRKSESQPIAGSDSADAEAEAREDCNLQTTAF